MKRKGFLYEQMCDKELIKVAIQHASEGKRNQGHVQEILRNSDKYAEKVLKMLQDESFQPSGYVQDIIQEGPSRKRREISKPRFYPDQVIHWCIYLVLKPWLFKRFYYLNCGSIPGKGVHFGKKYVQRWVRTDRKHTKYYLKMDVHHFYQSIQPYRVIEKLRTIIKDEKFIRLNEKILMQSDGLPIGMLLSQVYANFFLTDLDFWVKQELGAVYYLRYMDDMVIFGPNKKKLHAMRDAIEKRLNENGLAMKKNWQVFRLDKEPLDFMGFRFYRTHTTLRRSIMLAITRRVRKTDRAGKNVSAHDASAVISYLGWVKCSDSHNMFCKWIQPHLHIQRLKNAVRRKANERIQRMVGGKTGKVGPGIVPGQGVPIHGCA